MGAYVKYGTRATAHGRLVQQAVTLDAAKEKVKLNSCYFRGAWRSSNNDGWNVPVQTS